MNILITGGAGYIGNVLIDFLFENYKNEIFNITVLDNLTHRNVCLIEHCNKNNFNFIYGDVRNNELYKKLISKNDIIINLAAYVGMPICNKYPIEAQQVNYESVKFLADNLSNDQTVIFTTTNSGYGMGQHINGKAIYCDEETPLNPISTYGKTKCLAENVLLQTNKAISFRLATAFGVSKRMRLDLLVNDFTWRAFNDKFIVLFESHFLRNFIHVKDIANTILYGINNIKKMKGQIYNVGNDNINISKLDLCNKIKQFIPDFCIMESSINKDPDQRNYIVSNKKLQSLGWYCHYQLEDGIKELLKAYNIIKNLNN